MLTLVRRWGYRYLLGQGRGVLCPLFYFCVDLRFNLNHTLFAWLNQDFCWFYQRLVYVWVRVVCVLVLHRKEREIGSTPWRMCSMVLFLCRQSNPISGLVRLAMTMKRSLNRLSPTTKLSSNSALGVSKCPFGTNIWISGGGPSYKIVCGASNRTPCRSASEKALVNTPVSRRPSTVNSSKSIGKYSFLLSSIFNRRIVDNGKNFGLLPGIEGSCGMISVSITLCWHLVSSGGDLNFGFGEGSRVFTVHRSINAYLSLSDMWFIISLNSFWSFVKVLLNSSLSWP